MLSFCVKLRVLKLAQVWPAMNTLLRIIGNAVGALGQLTFILLIILYIFSIIGLLLFKGKYQGINFPKGVPRLVPVLLLASLARTDCLCPPLVWTFWQTHSTHFLVFFFLGCSCADWIIWCFHNPPNSDLTWSSTGVCDLFTCILLITDSCKYVCCESEGPDLLLSEASNNIHSDLL